MNHADIETLAKNWVVDAASKPADARVQQVVVRLLGDLCKAIEDLDISPSEFWSGVAYMAVDAGHRRQGVARNMLKDMINRYPHAELTCAVAKVPWFESMGFQVLGVRATQVLMNTRDHSSEGLMGLLDVASIYSSLEVRQIHHYLLQKHGKRAMIDAEKQRDRHLDQMTRNAKVFVLNRLGQNAANEPRLD